MSIQKKIIEKLNNLGIQKCKCKCFVPSKNDSKYCECGLLLFEHIDKIEPDPNIKNWSTAACTEPDGITDGYGDISFYNGEETSKYIRVCHKTEMDKILKLLFEEPYWNLNPPKLIISVTGGAKLKMTKTLKDVLCKGLVKVAMTTNGWITTGGTNGGIMKYVGETVKNVTHTKSKIVLLAISNWTTIMNNHQLIRDLDSIDHKPVKYDMVNMNKTKNSKVTPLEPNHSHFILVDNARLNKFGGEITLRAKLESEISKKISAPIVLVVVEGGPNTIETIYKSVIKNIPCVIIDKSGKISDILSDIYRYFNEDEEFDFEKSKKEDIHTIINGELKFKESYRNELILKLKKEFGDRDYAPEPYVRLIEQIFETKHRHLISVFELDSTKKDTDLDQVILNAFSKVNKKDKMAELCLSWNRVDIARQSIFNEEFFEMNIFEEIMYQAILKGNVEFVHLLLENGFRLKEFLTYERFLNLILKSPKTGFLIGLFRKKFKIDLSKNDNLNPEVISFKSFGRIVQNLAEDLFKHEFISLSYIKINLNNLSDEFKNKKLKEPAYHLFMFSILSGQFEMSKIFWCEGKNQISMALVANKILKSMAKKFDENYEELIEMANKYEYLACKALTLSHELNEFNTRYLLIRRVKELSDITCLQIAKSAKCLNFLSHSVCQSFLDKLWFNRIYPDTSPFLLYISMLNPFLAPCFVYFGDNKKYKTNEQNTNHIHNETVNSLVIPNIETHTQAENKTVQQIIKAQTNNNAELKEKKIVKKKENTRKMDSLIPTENLSYFDCLKHFIKAPYVKFIYSQISYLAFLILFSYVLLCDFYPINIEGTKETRLNTRISIPEIVLIIWIFVFIFDEIRQFFLNENRIVNAKINTFLKDSQNFLEISALFLFCLGTILRFIPSYNCYLAARIILCIDIMYWFFRSLYTYSFIKKMGPKLLMIRKMAQNLAYFFLIIFVFFFAFGISTQSLLYQNQELDINLLKQIFFPSYFVLGGDYYTLSTIMSASENCTSTDDSKCPNYVGAQVTIAIYVIYLIFLNILLLNILIALFNKTYNQIESESDPLWKFQRYSLVFEYFHKPIVPPPFSIFYYIVLLFRLILNAFMKLFINDHYSSNNKLVKFLNRISKIYVPGFYYNFSDDDEKVIKWESYIIDELLFDIEKESNDSKEYKLQQNIEKLEVLTFKYNIIYQNQKDAGKRLELAEKKLNSLLNLLKNRTQNKNTDFVSVSNVNLKEKELEISLKKEKFKQLSNTNNNLSDHVRSNLDKNGKEKLPAKQQNVKSPNDDYKPIKFTSETILQNLNADPDLFSYPQNCRPELDFNKYDEKFQIDRRSIYTYEVVNGVPLNPLGRTGVIGRGTLLYWGPNHGILAIFTRNKFVDGKILKTQNGQELIEVLVIEKNEKDFILPHILIGNSNYSDHITARRLIEKIFDDDYLKENPIQLDKLMKLIQNTKPIEKYIHKSSINTDNAWIEYSVVNYHDVDYETNHSIFHHLQLKNDSHKKYKWRDLNKNLENPNDLHNQAYAHLKRVCLSKSAFYE